MSGDEQKPAKPSQVISLTSDKAEKITEQFKEKGATFFDWEQFQKLTRNLPPNISIATILKSLKKTK